MSKNVLPKSTRVHIRRQKSLIRKHGGSYQDQKEEIENLYRKFIVLKDKNDK